MNDMDVILTDTFKHVNFFKHVKRLPESAYSDVNLVPDCAIRQSIKLNTTNVTGNKKNLLPRLASMTYIPELT